MGKKTVAVLVLASAWGLFVFQIDRRLTGLIDLQISSQIPSVQQQN
jgi:hypothetical protein